MWTKIRQRTKNKVTFISQKVQRSFLSSYCFMHSTSCLLISNNHVVFAILTIKKQCSTHIILITYDFIRQLRNKINTVCFQFNAVFAVDRPSPSSFPGSYEERPWERGWTIPCCCFNSKSKPSTTITKVCFICQLFKIAANKLLAFFLIVIDSVDMMTVSDNNL